MDISILNLSDIPAKISTQEYETGVRKLKKMWYTVHDYLFDKKDANNISVFNNILSNNENACILFSSGGTCAINYIKTVNTTDIKGIKTLVWYSDILHILSNYDKTDNVFCLYGLTLRSICELSEREMKKLNSFILNHQLESEIQQIVWQKDYSWKIFGWHALIFSQIFEYFHFQLKWSLLFLEFHGMEWYLIEYIIDVLALKWVLSIINWIILEKWIDSRIIEKFKSFNISNIYLLMDISFIPLYKNVTISWWKLLMKDS